MLRLTDAPPHGILLSTGAIPLLVGMLTTGDSNGRARAAMAIGSLAAGSEERAAAIARYSRESSGRSVDGRATGLTRESNWALPNKTGSTVFFRSAAVADATSPRNRLDPLESAVANAPRRHRGTGLASEDMAWARIAAAPRSPPPRREASISAHSHMPPFHSKRRAPRRDTHTQRRCFVSPLLEPRDERRTKKRKRGGAARRAAARRRRERRGARGDGAGEPRGELSRALGRLRAARLDRAARRAALIRGEQRTWLRTNGTAIRRALVALLSSEAWERARRGASGMPPLTSHPPLTTRRNGRTHALLLVRGVCARAPRPSEGGCASSAGGGSRWRSPAPDQRRASSAPPPPPPPPPPSRSSTPRHLAQILHAATPRPADPPRRDTSSRGSSTRPSPHPRLGFLVQHEA